MVIKNLTPMLWTDKIDETIEFYTKTLGFICSDKNGDWGWAGLYHGDFEIMLAKPNHHNTFDKPGFTGSFYFRIENVEKLWEELKE